MSTVLVDRCPDCNELVGDIYEHQSRWCVKVTSKREAKARIEAAAHDLYDALKELVAAGQFAVESNDDVAIMLRLGQATDAANAAIAKAEGRS